MENNSLGFDPLSDLDSVNAEDVKNLQSISGLHYDRYVSIPKLEVQPVLRVLENLSKVSSDFYAKNLYISADPKTITLKYTNSPYQLEYHLENIAQKEFGPVAIPIIHIRRLLNSISTNLIFVEDQGSISVCLGENLLFVETLPFDEKYYDFKFDVCSESLDFAYMKEHLKSFTSLLSVTNNAAEKNLICKGQNSYFNAGAILGKARNFFGNHSVILSKTVVDSITALMDVCESGVLMNLSEGKMTLEFTGLAKFEFPVITDEQTFESFLSPLFLNSFKYENSALTSNESIRQLLSVVNVLDYFTSFVKLVFSSSCVTLQAFRKDGEQVNYEFPYLDGKLDKSEISVAIPVLLSVLSKSNSSTRYSTVLNNLVIDLGSVIYCIRSNS